MPLNSISISIRQPRLLAMLDAVATHRRMKPQDVVVRLIEEAFIHQAGAK